ncbi:hypothetical protein ACLMJK_004766 [Lecanora helva]
MAPLSSYLPHTFSISGRSAPQSPPLTVRDGALFPLQLGSYLSTRATASPPQYKDPNYRPGAGTVNPVKVNNHAYFALFAILGAALVLASIWFFFWAKNGGFVFRKGDWEDYKSTVLRRKGPNGTTLSGATKTTRLGGGSVVAHGEEGEDEKEWRKHIQRQEKEENKKKNKSKPRGNRNNDDSDMRAYRHEKPAKVGGLNKESDGVFHQDFAYSDTMTSYSDEIRSSAPPSSIGSGGGHIPINTPRNKKDSKWARKTAERAVNEPVTPSPKKKSKPNFYNQTPNSNASTDSHRPLCRDAQSPGGTSTPTRSRQSSPTKHSGNARNSMPGSFRDFADDGFESRYSASNSDAGLTEDSRGTKAYFHPIPGLGGAGEGRGSVGNNGGSGFRRGRGRRDSLSDSEGETVMS